MKRNNKFKLNIGFLLLWILLLFASCYQTKPQQSSLYQYDFSAIYNPGQSSLHPECFVYHNTDVSSLLFFKQQTSELFFNQNKDGSKTAKLIVKYTLREQETHQLVDSLTSVYTINISNNGTDIISYLEIASTEGKKYDLIVLFADATKKTFRRVLIEVDKTSIYTSQNFFVETIENKNQPVFNNIVVAGKAYRITAKRYPNSSCIMQYYSSANKISEPPFIIQKKQAEILADSSFLIHFNDTLYFDSIGFYTIFSKGKDQDGFSLLNAGSFFPLIKTPKQMIGPLQYLASAKHIEKMFQSEDIKKSLDEFWLNKANDPKRARELIRIYYNRVQLANRFFSTHQEGWQTDRGMMYVVFGPPSVIHKKPNIEEWIYGDNSSSFELSFIFEISENRFSPNDYRLLRNSKYQTVWAQAIETWRKGKAYSITSK